MKNKISIGYLALGLMCIIWGIENYYSGWDYKYLQPTSKIGSIALICFGVIIIIFELIKFIKNSKKDKRQ